MINLQYDCICIVFSYLEIRDIINVLVICKEVYQVIETPAFFYAIKHLKCFKLFDQNILPINPPNWYNHIQHLEIIGNVNIKHAFDIMPNITSLTIMCRNDEGWKADLLLVAPKLKTLRISCNKMTTSYLTQLNSNNSFQLTLVHNYIKKK